MVERLAVVAPISCGDHLRRELVSVSVDSEPAEAALITNYSARKVSVGSSESCGILCSCVH